MTVSREACTGVNWDTLLRSCIHCGLCLNDCPTYRLSGDEADSPRGRLMILRQILDPREEGRWNADRRPLDRCLGCRGCETVCPSGVPYGELLAEARSRIGPSPNLAGRGVVWMVRHLIGHRRRLAMAAWAGRLLPRKAGILSVLPARRAHWPRVEGPRKGRVAVLAGCAQPVFSPGVLPATLKLIAAFGGEPFVPARQGCCGALAEHAGDREGARRLGQETLEVFEAAESIVVPSAGCSAHLRELPALFADDPELRRRAEDLAARTMDLVVWLGHNAHALDFRPDPRRVVFQIPCHLRHAQGIDGIAEGILGKVPGLELVEAPRAELCCGSAGAWSLAHPALARARRAEKLADLLSGRPELILTANPGCEIFLDAENSGIPVQHLAEYLAGQIRS